MIFQFLIGLLVLLSVLLILPFFNWPAIPANVFTSLSLYTRYIWSFNAYIPVDTIFLLARWVIGVELSFVGLRMIGKVMHKLSGRPNILEEVGHTTQTFTDSHGGKHTTDRDWATTKQVDRR